MALRYDEVADIIRIIDASACDELVLETPELKLVIRRRGGAAPAESPAPPTALTSPGPQAERAAASPRAAAPVAIPSAGGGTRSGGVEIRSPMVGTFYRTPSPDAPPFVEMGSQVQKGDAVCVIEVMKLFTTIYAEASGRIAHIGAENAELVEYGRVLFVIEETA
jgi:acetyl-CoA carboxylase biotin carboxyl carrier protein